MAAKAADIPHMVNTRMSFSSSFSHRPMLPETEPPSWRAAPSRPAEPPNRWVSTVERKISGAVRKGMERFSRTAIKTELVEPPSGIPARR